MPVTSILVNLISALFLQFENVHRQLWTCVLKCSIDLRIVPLAIGLHNCFHQVLAVFPCLCADFISWLKVLKCVCMYHVCLHARLPVCLSVFQKPKPSTFAARMGCYVLSFSVAWASYLFLLANQVSWFGFQCIFWIARSNAVGPCNKLDNLWSPDASGMPITHWGFCDWHDFVSLLVCPFF